MYVSIGCAAAALGVNFGHQVGDDVPRRLDRRVRLLRFERILGSRCDVAETAKFIEPLVELYTYDGWTFFGQY